jgi:hypothetical protein
MSEVPLYFICSSLRTGNVLKLDPRFLGIGLPEWIQIQLESSTSRSGSGDVKFKVRGIKIV